jgi:hypothetical protein
MKSKLVIIGLMISWLLAISVSGQQLTPQQIILQDDKSGDHLQFTISTGQYRFENCNAKFSISGVGKVAVSGCKVVLKDMSDTRRVLAEVDLCERVGKADIAFVGDSSTTPTDMSVVEFILSDSKTTDSTLDCAPKAIDLK